MSRTDAHKPFKHSDYVGDDGYIKGNGPVPVIPSLSPADRVEIKRQNKVRRHRDRATLNKIVKGEADADNVVYESSQLRDSYSLPSW